MKMTNSTTERFVNEYARRFGSRGDGVTDAIAAIRDAAIDQFARTGIPAKSEAWKYTNIAEKLSSDYEISAGSPDDLGQVVLPEEARWLAVCVNGRFSKELSRLPDSEGVVVSGLAHAVATDPTIASEYLGRYADVEVESLVALNAAFSTDGVYIRVEAGINVETPIHIVNVVSADRPVLSQARHLFLLGESSRATVIEHDSARVSVRSFTNSVVEAHVAANALLEHYRLQEKSGADHVDSTYVRQEDNSEYRSCVVSTGDGVVRNNLTVTVAGEHSHTRLRGLALADGDGHIDNFTLVEHAVPNCESDELYKSILAGKATSVFRGLLYVKEQAQKTAAFQSNRNLLLSPDAIANALPQLEIYADDVKCSHGATTGLLDQEALFYLRSRGISRPTARKMLIEAFVGEVVSEVDNELVGSRIQVILDDFLKSIEL
jgi:Fe-S cluster assembly protein SufD